MTRESILMQYQSECLEALKSVANIRRSRAQNKFICSAEAPQYM